MSGILVREMHAGDAPGVSALFPDLGYAATPQDVVQRLALINQWPHQAVFVADAQASLVGLCHVHGVRLLNSVGYAEVATLVVAASHQRNGVGGRLVAQAVAWSRTQGYSRVRLRTGLHREAAHRFYEAQGFKQRRASYAYELDLS